MQTTMMVYCNKDSLEIKTMAATTVEQARGMISYQLENLLAFTC